MKPGGTGDWGLGAGVFFLILFFVRPLGWGRELSLPLSFSPPPWPNGE